MIERLPGWANFLVLWLFYMAVSFGVIFMWRLIIGRFPSVGEYAILQSAIYAGGYLAKWRERQGGGWVFW